MMELRDLYQDMILDHSRKPRNFGALPDATRRAEGYHPHSGDQFTVYVRLEDDVIQDVRFEGSGCAISKASASMMTAVLKGKTRAEAEQVFRRFHVMVTGEPGAPFDTEALGKLAVFSGVCEFPVRVKCASLAWHTLKAALEGEEAPVTTE